MDSTITEQVNSARRRSYAKKVSSLTLLVANVKPRLYATRTNSSTKQLGHARLYLVIKVSFLTYLQIDANYK